MIYLAYLDQSVYAYTYTSHCYYLLQSLNPTARVWSWLAVLILACCWNLAGSVQTQIQRIADCRLARWRALTPAKRPTDPHLFPSLTTTSTITTISQ